MTDKMNQVKKPEGSPRVLWIDSVKGLAIVMVVFGHVLGGAITRHWLPMETLWQRLYEFIYLIHMPVFFMISGLLLYNAARVKPAEAFLSRLGSIVWPYLLWDVLIRWMLLPFVGRFMSAMPAQTGLIELLIQAISGHLGWFLWTLFVVQTIYILLASIPANYLLAISVAIYLFLPDTHSVPLHAIISFMPFLLVGVVARPYMDQLNKLDNHRYLLMAFVVYAALTIVVCQGWQAVKPVKLLCNVAGIFAAIATVQSFSRTWQEGVLSRLGEASLVIYLLHPYFQGASRAIVLLLIGQEGHLQIVVQTIAAVFGPLLIFYISERLGLAGAFRLNTAHILRKKQN